MQTELLLKYTNLQRHKIHKKNYTLPRISLVFYLRILIEEMLRLSCWADHRRCVRQIICHNSSGYHSMLKKILIAWQSLKALQVRHLPKAKAYCSKFTDLINHLQHLRRWKFDSYIHGSSLNLPFVRWV